MTRHPWTGGPARRIPLAPLILATVLLAGAGASQSPRPSRPATPAEFRKNLKMNREGWAYAHYTAGMGLGSATLDCRSPLVAGAV
ncbi:MAG: hypothetical protein M1457_13540, partial [bacterium]|nr:hypothetical protein [bacterium]